MSETVKDRAEALFLELLGVEGPRRGAVLEERCAGDEALRAEVESLLSCHDGAGSFLDRQELLALTPELVRLPDVPLTPGQRFGEYTIVRLIGSGGMGVVYVAQQERPRRTVALKLLHAGSASPGLLRRFELEAELLGRLQHPGIAQIFEAGAAEPAPGQGRRPFIAMELVDGPSLVEHARRVSLGTRARLELMRLVCEAVQHAHQRGIIHRDLKPANILVDESGRPKVLDFGVARATGADIALTTMQTSLGQLIGTLPYMSPEQVLGDPAEVDTRTDVYALGVVLYELLAGRHPIDVGSRSIPDAVRVIRTEDPRRLSSVDRSYRGEIETIVRKALEKDKNRRYQSASELGADISRHLAGEPITARQDSALYLLRKQIVRHKGWVTAGATGLVLLAAFSVYAAVQSGRNRLMAQRERAARIEADAARDEARAGAERLRKNLYVSAIGFAQAALAASDAGRVKRVLDSCPEDLRGWEWRYLRTVADTSERTMLLLEDENSIGAATPDGSRLVVLRAGAPVRILDGRTGDLVHSASLPGENMVVCRLSPDGRTGVLGTFQGSLVVLDIESGALRRFGGVGPRSVHPQAVWPGGDRAVVVLLTDERGYTAHVYSLESGERLADLAGDANQTIAAVSPDGALVAVGDDRGGVTVYNADGSGGRLVTRLEGQVRSVRFSPDGSRLAATGDSGALCVLERGS